MASPVSVSKGNVKVAGMGQAPVIPILLAVMGVYLVWFGIHYWRDEAIAWPSDPMKALLQGKPLPAPQRAPSASSMAATDTAAFNAAQAAQGSGGSSSSVPAGTAPTGPVQTQARAVLGQHGWTSPAQWAAFVNVVMAESGWNPRIANQSSGALGIAQALGHGNANTAGSLGNEYGGYGLSDAQAREANSGNAYYQLVWMANYIASRYGTPEAAWAYHQAHNSY